MTTREEHLEFCKQRARAYLDRGDVSQGITSMLSDLSKHDETELIGANMAGIGILYSVNHDLAGAKRFVEGFN